MPVGRRILERGQESDGWLDFNSSTIFRNIVQRLTPDTAMCLERFDCWKFLQTSIMDWKTVLQDAQGKTFPATLMMQQV
jgi:hypothetical protein